jgi:hypothetical protein
MAKIFATWGADRRLKPAATETKPAFAGCFYCLRAKISSARPSSGIELSFAGPKPGEGRTTIGARTAAASPAAKLRSAPVRHRRDHRVESSGELRVFEGIAVALGCSGKGPLRR